MIERETLQSRVRLCLSEAPVTVLLGARQTGKTTLARLLAAEHPQVSFFDLERPSSRAALSVTPELALRDCSGLVVIDEVQRMPELFELLRPLCDDPARKAVFLLLGSASLDIVKGVSESLAGRALFVQASGFSLEECDPKNMNRLWLQGGFPRSYLARPDAAWRWLDSFSQTLLERDIPQLGIRIPAETLRRFWLMLSHYHGQTWNAAEIGRSISCGSGAANHYRDLLAGSYMIRVLPPWFENLKKRQVKSPKIYLRDSGLLHRFLGVESMSDLRSHPRYGASWEGFALEQILIRFGDRDAYFWATQRGAELDLLLLRKGKRWGFEFKCTDAPAVSRAMHVALDDLGLEHLWVVYPGRDIFPMHPKITALPLSMLGELKGFPLESMETIG
ncbi:MAG: hypothetical protein DRP64_10380 [Verrucomicrobia bacterium]|nr:MAG: hypothetical protein DRP64_10380 [Verrucomicrobiota bacterium]